MALPNTHYGAARIAALLAGKKRLWFIGIGGVHMCQMALFAKERGYEVAGSDRVESETVCTLREAGIPVTVGEAPERIKWADGVIFTLAISPDNTEYTAAWQAGIPAFSRADFLAFLMADYPCRIGVSGSHGKSTVTAMLGEIFRAAERPHTLFCGAPTGRPASGTGDTVIFEACEYEDSFLCFSPTLSVVLNAEWEHVDHFPNRDAVIASFASFAALPGVDGRVLYNGEDAGAVEAVGRTRMPQTAFGIGQGSYRAADVRWEAGCAVFRPVTGDNTVYPPISLCVPGRHDLANAVAAMGAAHLCGIPMEAIARGLSRFKGAGRRMQYRGRLCGARVYEDYAHHPTEIAAALGTARILAGTGRVFAVFQSHTYSRTAAFFGEICAALRLADGVLIADIYPAREQDTLGMTASLLASGVGEKATAPGGLAVMAACLRDRIAPDDLVVVMGAGDIGRIFGEFSPKDFTIASK